MIRAVLRHLVALVLRVFFRRVAVTGAERVPATGPVLFVVNHPNALVDPLFLLGLLPRHVVFLAKEPLFRMPVVGLLVRAMGAIPIYRRQDAGADVARNRETFARVWREFARGGAVALFPEGTSHDDPKLRPFKTGAARLALGAASSADENERVTIVPAGLYYTSKAIFRSSALLCFGEPIDVPAVPLGPDGEPPAEPVRDLTARLEAAMAEVTLQADRHESLALVTAAERIFSSAEESDAYHDLGRQFELRRRFLDGYTALRQRAPERLERVTRLVERYQARLGAAEIAAENVATTTLRTGDIAEYTLSMLGTFVALAPFAIVGIVIHYPAYRVIGPIASGYSRSLLDQVATAKIMAALAFFPLTWGFVAAVIGARYGRPAGFAAGVAAPLTGYLALLFLERLDRFAAAVRGLMLVLFRPAMYARMVAERRQIREEILALAELV